MLLRTRWKEEGIYWGVPIFQNKNDTWSTETMAKKKNINVSNDM